MDVTRTDQVETPVDEPDPETVPSPFGHAAERRLGHETPSTRCSGFSALTALSPAAFEAP